MNIFDAAAKNKLETVAELICLDGNALDGQDTGGKTALHHASWRGHAQIVTLLLGRGSNPNIYDSSRHLPIHLACLSGHVAIVELLMDKGSNINANDNNYGRNPLHIACFKGHIDLVKLLLFRGVYTHVKDKWDSTPSDLALESDFNSLADLISKWPLNMLVVVLQELYVYHHLDCSSIIDFWQFI